MPTESPLAQIDALLQKADALPDGAARRLLSDTVRALMDMHGDGLSRIMSALSKNPNCKPIIDTLIADEMVSGLLLIYDLHPQDLKTRVGGALEKVRPYLASHGGNVELLGISDDGAVSLVLQGSCHGCPSSAQTLKSTIEQAIYERAPDVTAIHVQEPKAEPAPSANGFVSLDHVVASAARQHQTMEHQPQGVLT